MAKSRDAKSNESSGTQTARAKTAARGATTDIGARDTMTSATGGSVASMKEQTTEVFGHAQEQAASIVGMASQPATTQLGMQKDRAAGTLGAVATALHEAGRQMRQQDEPAIAGYIEAAAGQVEQLSTMLREQDINQILNTTAQFARRQPALFLAGAFAVGFIGTRFLKSSAPSRGQSFGSGGYAMPGDWDRSRRDAFASGSWSAGYGTTSGLGSGTESGSAASSGRQEEFSGTSGARSGSDWSSRDGASLGSEGS